MMSRQLSFFCLRTTTTTTTPGFENSFPVIYFHFELFAFFPFLTDRQMKSIMTFTQSNKSIEKDLILKNIAIVYLMSRQL